MAVWRSKRSLQKRRKKSNELKRHLWATSPEYREKRRLYAALKRLQEPEKATAKSRRNYYKNKEQRNAQRAKWARENREREAANRRANYHRNKADRLAKIYAGRRRRNPLYGLEAAIRRLEEGSIKLDEFTQLYGGALAHLDEKMQSTRTRLARAIGGHGQGEGGDGVREAVNLDDQNAVGHTKIREGVPQ